MINKSYIPKLNSDILWRRDGAEDEIVVLASFKGGPIRFLNPVGGMILELSNGQNSVEDIVNYIESNYQDVPIKTVEKDIFLFLKILEENKIIKY